MGKGKGKKGKRGGKPGRSAVVAKRPEAAVAESPAAAAAGSSGTCPNRRPKRGRLERGGAEALICQCDGQCRLVHV